MKTPPFLLLAALTFWGWQSGSLYFGIGMGVILESSRFIQWRWDFSETDFRRIYNLCTVLAFALVAYLYANDDQGGGFKSLLHRSTGNNTLSGIHALTAMLRWLPMLWFLFVVAQNFSEHESVPLSSIGLLILRWRRAAGQNVNVSYPYFIICLFSAGIHENDGTHGYFWGQCVLIAWALWPLRARRFKLISWAAALLLVIVLAYLGARGIGQLASLVETYNAQWMARYFRNKTDPTQSITAIGEIGQLKLSGAIVIRLETESNAPPPDYLREASYVNYSSPGRHSTWYAGNSQSFTDVAPETNGSSTYILLPEKTSTKSVGIECYLNGWSEELKAPEGLLPLPDGSRRLENVPPDAVIKQNRTGAVSAAGLGFITFTAAYAAGATIDSPPDTNWDWSVPTNEVPALKKIADGLKLSGASEDKILLTVQQFFADNFTYRTWQGLDKTDTNGTPLARFLLSTRAGHCEYFATATVLLLRELKIPARYAVGYYVHEADGDGHYVVRERDAHAWCLVWDAKNKTWENFDTTPASWVATEGKRASFFQPVSDFFSWLHFQFSKFRWGQANLRQYILWALVPVIPFLLYQIIFRRRRKPQRPVQNKTDAGKIVWPGLDSEFYRLENRLAARGIPRRAGETFSDWLERVLPEKVLRELRAPLQEVLRLHYRHRFDPAGLSADERKSLKQKVETVLEKLTDK